VHWSFGKLCPHGVVDALFNLLSARAPRRSEARSETERFAMDDHGRKWVLDLRDLRDKCFLMTSILQEIIRMRNKAALFRGVRKDVVLDNTYLIKKDAFVLVPGAYFQHEKSIWGADHDEFYPWRLMYIMKAEKKSASRQQKSKYWLDFGKTPYICPGRHFVTSELAALVAMKVVRYDMVPEDGEWVEPPVEVMGLAGVNRPKWSPEVKVTMREEYEGAGWDFVGSERINKYPLVNG
jgi:cytochrome P450